MYHAASLGLAPGECVSKLESIRRWLQTPRAHVPLIAAALLLSAPAISNRLALDDHVLALAAGHGQMPPGLHVTPLSPFRFTTGHPVDNHALMDGGVLLPWWSDPHHRNAFFRPLSALTHLLDFRLWPDAPWLMHLHSLGWFCVLLGVVAHVYRRLAPAQDERERVLAMLAFALFAFDDAHGMTVAWIANRNALVAAALALPALSAHHRWVAQGWRPGAWLGPACFALGLCAGETALAVLGYVLAHVAVLDRASFAKRAARLLPYAAIVGAYGVLFVTLGLGSAGSGAYRDPVREPVAFAVALVHNLPVLLSAQLGLPLADAAFWGAPEAYRALWLVSAATLVTIGWLCSKLLRADRIAAFHALGMLLSACAVAASVPGERLLLVVGIGGAGLVARLLLALHDRLRTDERRRAWTVAALALAGVHLVLAPLSLPVRAWSIELLGRALDRAERSIPGGPEIADNTVVIVNAPFDVMASYVQPARAARSAPRPRHLYWLASASSEIDLTSVSARTLSVRPRDGWLHTPLERHYRGRVGALRAGASVTLSDMTARVTESNAAGRPAVVEFDFPRGVRSRRTQFLRWRDGRFEPFDVPPPGHTVHFPREDFFRVVIGSMFGT